MGTMFDTTDDPRGVLSGLTVDEVAAYGNGRFANYGEVKALYPHAHVLEIDVAGAGIGDAGDFESGDMAYGDAGEWAKRRMAAGVRRPVIYFSASAWPEVMHSLASAGVARHEVRLWTAHYTGRPHRCSSACGFGITGVAEATQWGSSDAGGTLEGPYRGRNIDVSMTGDDFWNG
jgi:hypothetical protein